MFRIYKGKDSLIAARRNGKWRLVFAEIAAFKGVEIIYVFNKNAEFGCVEESGEENSVKVETEIAEKTEEVVEVSEEIANKTEEEVEIPEEVSEETEEVPLEIPEEEEETALEEEASLDGNEEEVKELLSEEEEPEEITDVKEETEEEAEEEPEEEAEEKPAPEEEKEEEKAEEKKETFKLTAPENLEEIFAGICAKRARKLIYRPNEELFSMSCEVLGTDKNNEEKINVKKILEAEIKEGVKLGYLDKFDGLKGSELKEEYENDIVYEFAEQEFKKTGLLYDGKKVKVYIFDWDLKSCHHIGCISDEDAEKIKPYLIDKEKYSFDVNGIITGGKYKKIIKDAETGKITVEKGNDRKLGVEIDVTVINRKD